MITTKACARIAVGALAAMAILAPATAQAAEPWPHAQAAAAVQPDGTLSYGKNIVSVSRPIGGVYCVTVGKDIDLSKAAVQVTSWGDIGKTSGVWTTPHARCNNATDAIMVLFRTAATQANADSQFFLTIS
ncbi:hypothetical protein [Streptosporangium roseum]|uniref:hypothetical protein n=1 Tax=Streptosporangium roseum TaxID=2001 RepID=UPI0033220364